MCDAAGLDMFDRHAVTLFRVRGVPIRAHWTLLLIFPYLAIVLSTQFRAVAELAGVDGAQLSLPPLLWGALIAVGLFASITLHELAHSFAAVRFGGRVRSITLMLVGGVSQIAHLPRVPRQEAIVAVVGPAMSLALGALFGLVYAGSGPWPADVRMALFYLGGMNLTLGLFNLIPAFPMDGGRLVRAILAVKVGPRRATELAAHLGRACAVALFVLGLWSSNLMMLLIAVFVYTGARAAVEEETIRDALGGLRVVDLLPVLHRPPPLTSPEALLGGVLARMRELDRLELVVLDASSAPIGVIQAGDLARIPSNEQWSTTVGDLATKLPRRHVVIPLDASANEAIERAAEAGADYLVVVDPIAEPHDAVIGLIATGDIARTVTFQLLSRPRPASGGARAVQARGV